MFADYLENDQARLISLAKSDVPLVWLRNYDLRPKSDKWQNEDYDFASETNLKSAKLGMKLRKSECAFVLTIELKDFGVIEFKRDIEHSIRCLGFENLVSCFEMDGNGFQIVHLANLSSPCEMILDFISFEWTKKSRRQRKLDYKFEIRKSGDFIPLPHHIWGNECVV